MAAGAGCAEKVKTPGGAEVGAGCAEKVKTPGGAEVVAGAGFSPLRARGAAAAGTFGGGGSRDVAWPVFSASALGGGATRPLLPTCSASAVRHALHRRVAAPLVSCAFEKASRGSRCSHFEQRDPSAEEAASPRAVGTAAVAVAVTVLCARIERAASRPRFVLILAPSLIGSRHSGHVNSSFFCSC